MPGPDAALSEVARWIAIATPIRHGATHDEDCRVRRMLLSDVLDARGVTPGRYRWFTAQLADGRITGRFAESRAEAELSISVWWGRACFWVVPDPKQRILEEYFPADPKPAVDGDQPFPLLPPRKPRDRFAPTSSLLEGLDAPSSPTAEIG